MKRVTHGVSKCRVFKRYSTWYVQLLLVFKYLSAKGEEIEICYQRLCTLTYVTSVRTRLMILCNLSLPAKEKRFIPEHGFLHNGAGERNRKNWLNLLVQNCLLTIYRVIQEKRSIFWRGNCVCHCEEKPSHEHVSNSEWLPK